MSAVPCEQNPELQNKIREFAEALKCQAHTLGNHGLEEGEFYQSGLFRGAIERLRGQFAATMATKREFVRLVLNYMQDQGFILDYQETGGQNRHDYVVEMPSKKKCVIELKGGGDGNNTTIFDRPAYAEEFVVWSVMQNSAGDPRKNVWSAIHTRLSSEIIERKVIIDGFIAWDWVCGTIARPCPKLSSLKRLTNIGHYEVPPACIYVFPKTVPEPRNNPSPKVNSIEDVEFLNAVHKCFQGSDNEINYVQFSVNNVANEIARTTSITRWSECVQVSKSTIIRRR